MEGRPLFIHKILEPDAAQRRVSTGASLFQGLDPAGSRRGGLEVESVC